MKIRWERLGSDWIAFCFMLAAVLWFGKGQEVWAIFAPHDDFYFLRRSEDWLLAGSHMAPIKEVLYPLFLKVPRFLGLGLRQFEAACYAAACFSLWKQVRGLAESRVAAWLTTLPLLFFPFQHPVFNRSTYDALQLILVPLTFATSIAVVRHHASPRSLAAAGAVVAAQAMNRAEGILFAIPPMLALGWECGRLVRERGWVRSRLAIGMKAGLLLLIPVASSQAVCAANFIQFGFWSTTIVQSRPFRSCLGALMRIRPPETKATRYVPVPNDALVLALEASPSLRRTRPFFEANTGGNGWSRTWGAATYEPPRGHLDGGHLQWALLDAAASVAGEDTRAIGTFLDSAAGELKSALDRGTVPRRSSSDRFGPGFSVFSRAFAVSLGRVGGTFVNLGAPPLPTACRPGSEALYEAAFDRLALRHRAWVGDPSWMVSGWILDSGHGLPDRIRLNDVAVGAGLSIRVAVRPDVDQAFFPNGPGHPTSECGFRLESLGPPEGDLVIEFPGQQTLVPAAAIVGAFPDFFRGSLRIHVEAFKPPVGGVDLRQQIALTWFVFKVMRVLIAVAWPLLAVIVLWPAWFGGPPSRQALAVAWVLALSVALPRLVLFSAIDANLFCGVEPRYCSAGAFSIWFLATFTVGLAAAKLAATLAHR